MSEEQLTPSRDELVLHGCSPDSEAMDRARSLGSVECLESSQDSWILRVTPKKTSREAWQAATRTIGTHVPIVPVLYDENRTPLYPTGEVTIRFDAAPSDSDLHRFCDAQGLRLLRRNKLAAKQVVCEPVEPASEFLPDIVARLASQPGVHRAWANTVSRYRRAAE